MDREIPADLVRRMTGEGLDNQGIGNYVRGYFVNAQEGDSVSETITTFRSLLSEIEPVFIKTERVDGAMDALTGEIERISEIADPGRRETELKHIVSNLKYIYPKEQ